MEAQSINSVETLSVPEDKPQDEPPNNVKNNCEKRGEIPQPPSDAPVMETVDGGSAVPAGEVVSNNIASEDKQDMTNSENKKDIINNEKEAALVHIEPALKESIALDKPKRQRKKKEPKDYDVITSSAFCHVATSPSRAQNKSPSRGSRSPGRSGSNPSHGGQSPGRGGQSPARSSHSPARGGQSPARGNQITARGVQTPARGGQSPVRRGQNPAGGGHSPACGGQSPARSCQSPARCTQSPARGRQSPSRSTKRADQSSQSLAKNGQNSTNDSQSPGKDGDIVTCDGKPVNGTEITSQVGQSPLHNSEILTIQEQSKTEKSCSDNSRTDHSPSKKCSDTDSSGQDAKLSLSNSVNSPTESSTEKKGGNTDFIDKITDSDVSMLKTATLDSKKSVKKKAPKKNTKSIDSDMKQNAPLKQCSKKAKKRKSDGEPVSENTSGAVVKIGTKQMKSPVINNKHGDIKDGVNEQSEPKKKKCKKTVKLNDTTNGINGSNLEKENTGTESASKAKKKCAKKKQLDKDIGSISKDALDTADKLDTITAVLNHVIAESTKCYLEENVHNDKPVKSKKKPAARKKVQQPKLDKMLIENNEKTNSEPADSIVTEHVNSTQQASVDAAASTKTEKEKKAKKKAVKAIEESIKKQDENLDCKKTKKKPAVKSKTVVKGNTSENNSVPPSVMVAEDKLDALSQNTSVPSNDTNEPLNSITHESSNPHKNTSPSDAAASRKPTPDNETHCIKQAAAGNLEEAEGDEEKQAGDVDHDGHDINEHSNQEASEGSKNGDGAQSSGSGSENRVFQCPKCSYNSKKKVSLRRHMTVHGVYECAHCDFVSDQNSEYEDHMRNKHPSRCGRKLCKKCNVLFRVDEIEQHEKECTGEKKKWSCSECKKEFKFLCTMRAHVQKWHVSSGIKCDKCEFEANTNYTLKKHIMKVHKPAKEKKPISCTECNKTFSSDSCYRQHMKLHEGQEYECPKCGKVFKSTRSMQTHVKIHDETKSVPCEVEGCTKVFKNVKVMEIHRKRCHENEPKKFKCTYGTCEQRFYTKYHLKRHEIMHTGERNYKCTYPDCSKAFHHAENLKVHLRSHNNIKCPQCRRTFKEESSLQTHLKIHENAKSRTKKKRKPPLAENTNKPVNNTESKPDATSPAFPPSDMPVEKTGATDESGKDGNVTLTTESQNSTNTPNAAVTEEPEPKKLENTQHDVYDFHDSDDEKLAVSAIARQMSPNKSPRIKVGGELLGTLPLPSAPDAMLVKSVTVSDDEPVSESNKTKKKPKKKKVAPENTELKTVEAENKSKEKKKVIKKKKAQEGGEKKGEDKPVEKVVEKKEEEKLKKAKKPKKKVEKKTKEKVPDEKPPENPERKEDSESKAKKKKPRKKKIEKELEGKEPKDEVVEPEKKKRKKKPKKVEETEPVETAEEPNKEPEPEPVANLEAEHEPSTDPPPCDPCPGGSTDSCAEESGEHTEMQPEEDGVKPKEDETHQSEPEIGPQPSPTPEYLDDQQHGFFSPRPEQVEFQYPMAPRPVSPEEDDDDIDMIEMEQNYSEEQQEQKETKVLESPLSEMSSDMKSLTLPSVSRESPGANQEENDQHSDLVAGLSPTIKDISGQEDEMLNDIAKQVEAESAITEEEATDMPPSNYPSSIHTTPPSVQPPSVPPASVPPPPQEVPVITSHTSHIMEESSAIGDMVSRYEGEAATRDLYQAPLSNSSSNQQQSSHHYSSIVDQQLSHKYLQEAPLSVQSHGHMLPDDNPTPTSSSPPSIPPPKYYMDGSSYPPSVYHSHRVPSVPPSDLPPTSPPGPAETTPTYSDSLSHSSSHYRSDSQACPSYPPRDSLPSVTTPSYSSPPQNSYLDPHSASMVNNKEDTAIPSVSSAERPSDSMYLTTRSSNLPASAPETLPANSSAPPSVSFGSDSLPTRELFGQYFGQDSTGSMPLTHPPLSQEQRGLPYPHSQSQTSLPTLPAANSADYFRRASAPFIPGTGYPSVTETLVPPPPQHWMSAHDERSRQWGQPSPIIPPPIPSELDSTSPLSRNPYVSRPSDYSFNPTTTSHSSKQTDSSYPGSQSISTPAERPTYDMTSAYMTSRTFNPNYTGPMPPPPPSAATQKQLEEAYRRAAQISDYRTLSQAAPPSMADMYSRMAVPPALGFDKYYYPRDAMFRSQHLSAAPNPFMTQSSTPQMPYTERDYSRNPIYTQHSAYGFMGDKQYLASNKLPPTLPGLQERPMPADYLQSPAAAAAMGDPHIQDPYRRSVIYNMMSRYF